MNPANPDLKIGFTGTRRGLTPHQRHRLRDTLRQLRVLHDVIEAHHGDCVGADAEFDMLVRAELNVHLVIHPPASARYRAWCGRDGDDVRTTKGYIWRDHDIVDECDLLLAAPHTAAEILRSGTWATVRYARKIQRQLIILAPAP